MKKYELEEFAGIKHSAIWAAVIIGMTAIFLYYLTSRDAIVAILIVVLVMINSFGIGMSLNNLNKREKERR